MHYLLKTEPEAYSIDDLARDHETIWDGVANPQAVKNLREMHRGDELVIYHTGDERRAVGLATVISVDTADPKVPVVRIRMERKLEKPRSLDEMKAVKLFVDSPLMRQGRLSVVPLTGAQYAWLAR